jgi:predicted anti-sigma-YlaC factor YlaD
MNCKSIQEKLLTDFIDQELDPKDKKEILDHLAQCPDCRLFWETAKKNLADPFENIPEQDVPESVWQNIQHAIIEEKMKAVEEKPSGFLEPFLGLKYALRPLLMALLVVFIVAAAVRLRTSDQRRRMSQSMQNELRTESLTESFDVDDQVVYFAYLLDGDSEEDEESDEGFGSDIENYFL